MIPYQYSHVATDPLDNDVSTGDTIGLMKRYVGDQAVSMPVLSATQQAFADLPPGATDEDKIRAVFYFVKDHLRFQNDVATLEQLGIPVHQAGTEFLIPPVSALALGVGDCDDFSMLAAAMLQAAGIATRFVTV